MDGCFSQYQRGVQAVMGKGTGIENQGDFSASEDDSLRSRLDQPCCYDEQFFAGRFGVFTRFDLGDG